MITLLDRYVTRELVGPLLFGLAMFSTLLVVATALIKLVNLAAAGAPAGAILQLFALRWLILLPFVLPMAMLLAALLTFGRLSSDSELVAIQAAGTPLLRAGVAALVIGLLLSVGSLLINEHIVPPAARQAQRLEVLIHAALKADLQRDLDRGKPFIYEDMERGQLRRVFVAQRFDVEGGRMYDVTFLQYDENRRRRVQALIEAKLVEWREANLWIFRDGVLKYVEGDAVERRPVERFQEMEIRLNRTPRELRAALKEPEAMTYHELSDYLQNLREQGIARKRLRDLEVELHRKLADPFICLVFALIGTPLGIRRQRGGAAVGLGLSILIVFSFYLLWSSARVLGQNGAVAPLAAAWLANAVGLVFGLFLTWRAAR